MLSPLPNSTKRAIYLLSAFLVLAFLMPVRVQAEEAPGDGGVVSPQAEEIVGGQPATPGEWPWQARLSILPGFLCGGSLIHPRWVLTAAHCLVDRDGNFGIPGSYVPPATVTVFLGDHNRSIAESTEQQQDIVQIVIHPGYRNDIVYPDANNDDNDIALLKLATPVELSQVVQPISLVNSPADDPLFQPDTQAIVTGWGRTDTTNPASVADVLQEVEVPIVSNTLCETAYPPGSITGNMLCAGYEEGGKDSCQGDSGGPLLVQDGSGGWKQAGIVSFGQGCALPNIPGVYTRVANYVGWIQQYIGSPNGPDVPRNANFDQGRNGDWLESSTFDFNVITNTGLPVPPRSGSYLAWLGGLHLETTRLFQIVPLSERATTLAFYYQINSSEDDCLSDVATILLDGVPVATRALCPPNNTSDWTLGTVDLTGYAGRTVELRFRVVTDGALLSSLLIDDVSIINAPPPPLLLNSFTPASGRSGTVISANGSNFLDVSEVLINGVAAPFAVQSDTVLNLTVPEQAGTGPITVKTAYSSITSATSFTVLRPLNVNQAGAGSGTVTSDPAGIFCDQDCSEDYAHGTLVTLTAAPSANSVLVGWSGACSGTAATCMLTMDAAKDVIVTFDLQTFALNVTKAGNGNGSVTSDPVGIQCGGDCTETYPIDAQVTLTAQPAADSLFEGWSGACTGTQPTCVVTMNEAKNVTATFSLKTFTLNVAKAGAGSGTITSAPAGIACGDDCTETYTPGTQVTLMAQADDGSEFTGWSSPCTGAEPTCTVTVNADLSITATFEPAETNLYVPLIH